MIVFVCICVIKRVHSDAVRASNAELQECVNVYYAKCVKDPHAFGMLLGALELVKRRLYE